MRTAILFWVKFAFSLFLIIPTASIPLSAETLLINEVGSSSFYTDIEGIKRADVPTWFEIFNASDTKIDISTYQIRTTSNDRASRGVVDKIFDLPKQILNPRSYLVVRGRSGKEAADSFLQTEEVVYINDSSGHFPTWKENGFIEILQNGLTIDFLRFGASPAKPRTMTAWSGAGAPALPYGQNKFGFSIARDESSSDTNEAKDWALGSFSTPVGPNDITCDTDDDQDGIPDCSELPNSTFAGLPLYEWGARTKQRDIFIEVDYMLRDPQGGQTSRDDEGVVPHRQALEKVRAAFAHRNVALHFDVGKLFHRTGGISPNDFDLGGGNAVPFHKGVAFGKQVNLANVYEYKKLHMSAARKQIFHYMLFANTQNANGARDISGKAELPGNDSIITLGAWRLNTATPTRTNLLINFQAGTIMHEFGHNLNLRHGGFEHTLIKPNYFSVMNYLYQLPGLPDASNPAVGDRYYYRRIANAPFLVACQTYVKGLEDLHLSPAGDPGSHRIDYSDGSSHDIDENAVNEANGIARGKSGAVDYNCDGKEDANIAFNIDSNPSLEIMRDYDDWANIDLYFQRTGEGDRSGLSFDISELEKRYSKLSIVVADVLPPVADDEQPVAEEIPPSPEFFEWLDAIK